MVSDGPRSLKEAKRMLVSKAQNVDFGDFFLDAGWTISQRNRMDRAILWFNSRLLSMKPKE